MRLLFSVLLCFLITVLAGASDVQAQLPKPVKKNIRAGAAVIDITPDRFPVVVNGGFLSRKAKQAYDRLHARCLVLDDGKTRIALVVVDSCMLPRKLIDEAKELVPKTAGIPPNRILISATHTHSAPSAMGALGTDADPNYPLLLPRLISQCISMAAKRLQPARIGWAVVDASRYTNCRRWILRPDRLGLDPFGKRTVRAMMHPGYQNPSYIGPAGPIDPDFSIVAVQSTQGKPIALLANFSMHYYGASALSADYFGRYCDVAHKRIAAGNRDFVAIMSQGTSGDLHWMDYRRPRKPRNLNTYAQALAKLTEKAWKNVQFKPSVSLGAAQTVLKLKRRVPDAKRLAWAAAMVKKMGKRPPRNRTEVYAREQLLLHKRPVRDLILQAIRIGDCGITAIPNEVYGITGLKIKAQSPLRHTFNIELANGSEGYIPPPEQHHLGGYTTWPARTASLEVQAEPKIVNTVLALLEKVSNRKRKKTLGDLGLGGAYPKAVLSSKPLAYWRMGEFAGTKAIDVTKHGNDASYEPGVVFYLPGPQAKSFSGRETKNRAPQFAGGRAHAKLKGLGTSYSVELWFYNGMPIDARPVTGYIYSRGPNGDKTAPGDHLGIGGTQRKDSKGKMIFFNGNELNRVIAGKTAIQRNKWYHVVIVRDGERVLVYLGGKLDLKGSVKMHAKARVAEVFVGGRSDKFANFEGRVDEVSIYGRALTAAEIGRHFATSASKAVK